MDFKGINAQLGDIYACYIAGIQKIKSVLAVGYFLAGVFSFVPLSMYTQHIEKQESQEWVYMGLATKPFSLQKTVTPLADLMKADTAVAVYHGLPYPEFHKENIFMNPQTGEIRNIWMAVLASNDTDSGGALAGYSWIQNLNPGDQEVLHSLTNACVNYVDPDTVQNIDTYTTGITEFWVDCGYITTIYDIEHQLDDSIFFVYPNPFQYGLTMEFDNGISVIELYNANGQKVYEINVELKGNRLFLQPDIMDGLYIIKAQTHSGKVITKKLIRQG